MCLSYQLRTYHFLHFCSFFASDLYNLNRNYLQHAGVEVDASTFVEISPLVSYRGEGLDAKRIKVCSGGEGPVPTMIWFCSWHIFIFWQTTTNLEANPIVIS